MENAPELLKELAKQLDEKHREMLVLCANTNLSKGEHLKIKTPLDCEKHQNKIEETIAMMDKISEEAEGISNQIKMIEGTMSSSKIEKYNRAAAALNLFNNSPLDKTSTKELNKLIQEDGFKVDLVNKKEESIYILKAQLDALGEEIEAEQKELINQ